VPETGGQAVLRYEVLQAVGRHGREHGASRGGLVAFGDLTSEGCRVCFRMAEGMCVFNSGKMTALRSGVRAV
jgi:hypothetical protein